MNIFEYSGKFLFIYLFISVSIYLSIYLSIICLSIDLSIHLFIHSFIYLFIFVACSSLQLSYFHFYLLVDQNQELIIYHSFVALVQYCAFCICEFKVFLFQPIYQSFILVFICLPVTFYSFLHFY